MSGPAPETKKEDRATQAGQYPLHARGRTAGGCESPCASALLLPLGEGATLRGQRRESSKKAPSSELLNLSDYLLQGRIRDASRLTNRDAVGVQREVEQRTFALWLIRIEHAFADVGVAEHLGGLTGPRIELPVDADPFKIGPENGRGVLAAGHVCDVFAVLLRNDLPETDGRPREVAA